MAGGSLYEDEDEGVIAGINVTPLVDITLVLLIIFMVTAKLIVKPDRAIPGVQPPKVATGVDLPPPPLALTLDKDGALFFNEQRVQDRAAIRAYMKEVAASDPDVQVLITADGRRPYAEFMDVLAMVREAGVTKYALTVEDKAPPR